MVIQKQISTRAWGELLLLGMVWGGVFLAAAIALEEIPPFTLVAIRISLAALVLWAVALLRGSRIPKGWKVWAALFVRVSDLLCMIKMVHASPTKEHEYNDDIKRTARRAA